MTLTAEERASAQSALDEAARLHAPVMAEEVVAALDPSRDGVFIDGTFGAGGYTRLLLDRGADLVIGLDRDPEAIARGQAWAPLFEERLALVEARFSSLDAVAADLAPDRDLIGVALDVGVSSMQIDAAERGFSFQKDGPLDMRMAVGGDGPTAADLVNSLDAKALADILYTFGEERASRRIAQAIVDARADAPIETTAQLADIVSRRLPRPKPGQPHPATRSFQALRIAVNEELDELTDALRAAERALAPGGVLAVVSFHSLEDRIVKRFLQDRGNLQGQGSRHSPPVNPPPATFTIEKRSATTPDADEVARNPRARSAKLRVAVRTAEPPRENAHDRHRR